MDSDILNANLFFTLNPRTGDKIRAYNYHSQSVVEDCLQRAITAYDNNLILRAQLDVDQWIKQRQKLLLQLAAAFADNKQKLSDQISLEMGKVATEAVAEIEKAISAFAYYSENLPQLLQDEVLGPTGTYKQTRLCKMPLGPVLAIMPWNFPVWQLIRFAAPSVAIGNPILLKHSDITAGVAELIEDIFMSVDPSLLFNLRINHEQAAQVIADCRVRAVTLTGSSRAGRQVASLAGNYLKKTVLELGGSDPYLVFADADLPNAALICARSRMINNGQSCIAAKRFLVEKSVADEFIKLFCAEIEKLSQAGIPLASWRFKNQLMAQFNELNSIANDNRQSLELVLDMQNKIHDSATDLFKNQSETAAFFAPKVFKCSLDFIKNYQQELFGPMALIASFDNVEQAIDVANASVYGLGSAVFAKDLSRASQVAMRLQSGVVAINDFVKSDPKIPFGGVKDSGYGKELGVYGFDEFCIIKSIVSA